MVYTSSMRYPCVHIHVHVFRGFFDFVFYLNKPVAYGAASWSGPAARDCMRGGESAAAGLSLRWL